MTQDLENPKLLSHPKRKQEKTMRLHKTIMSYESVRLILQHFGYVKDLHVLGLSLLLVGSWVLLVESLRHVSQIKLFSHFDPDTKQKSTAWIHSSHLGQYRISTLWLYAQKLYCWEMKKKVPPKNFVFAWQSDPHTWCNSSMICELFYPTRYTVSWHNAITLLLDHWRNLFKENVFWMTKI